MLYFVGFSAVFALSSLLGIHALECRIQAEWTGPLFLFCNKDYALAAAIEPSLEGSGMHPTDDKSYKLAQEILNWSRFWCLFLFSHCLIK